MQPQNMNLQIFEEKSQGGGESPSPGPLSSHPHNMTANLASSSSSSTQDFDPGYFFQTPRWKRFSVTMSVLLSIISLCTGAIAQLARLDVDTTRALLVTGIVVNGFSVTLSALTSLNWQSPAVQERQFMERFVGMVNLHSDGKMSLSHAAHSVHQRFGGRKV